jgi:hypothetical protein
MSLGTRSVGPEQRSRNALGIVCALPYSRNHEHLFLSFLLPQNVSVLACPCPLQRYIVFDIHVFLVWAHPVTGLHASARRSALTKMGMPAMSPTMVEGGISQWKKAEGETFSAGDVLLEIVCTLFPLKVLCQHLTAQRHRKPTKRSSTWKHKRTASSRRLSYVMTLYLCTHPVSRVHVIGSGRVKECCCG